MLWEGAQGGQPGMRFWPGDQRSDGARGGAWERGAVSECSAAPSATCPSLFQGFASLQGDVCPRVLLMLQLPLLGIRAVPAVGPAALPPSTSCSGQGAEARAQGWLQAHSLPWSRGSSCGMPAGEVSIDAINTWNALKHAALRAAPVTSLLLLPVMDIRLFSQSWHCFNN